LVNLTVLQGFAFNETGLCEPQDTSFQTWLSTIERVDSSGLACTSTDICATVTEISQAECRVLETLYNSANGPNWTNNTGWLQTNTPCSWYGVTCADGRVKRLDLSHNQLNGHIPSEISNLSSLKILRLIDSIPTELGNLSNLIYLDLSQNQLIAIPPEIGELSKLNHLLLWGNKLTGLPAAIGNLANLRDRHLENNQLVGSLPTGIENLSNLANLYLNDYPFTGSRSQFKNLSNLKTLYLHNNPCSDTFPTAILELRNLYKFDLSKKPLCRSQTIQLESWLDTIHIKRFGEMRRKDEQAEITNSWTWKYTENLSYRLNDIGCPTKATCFAVGQSGTIVKTEDGGQLWFELNNEQNNLYAISCPSETACLVSDKNGNIVATDGSKTWYIHEPFHEVSCVRGLNCSFIEDALNLSIFNIDGVECIRPVNCSPIDNWRYLQLYHHQIVDMLSDVGPVAYYMNSSTGSNSVSERIHLQKISIISLTELDLDIPKHVAVDYFAEQKRFDNQFGQIPSKIGNFAYLDEVVIHAVSLVPSGHSMVQSRGIVG
ncbi:MAG: hypothetical protein AAF639_31145, partial [Chloroflexota bacterium]